MKKRIKKKLEKRCRCFHYSDARRKLLIRAIKRKHPEAELIVIKTSKRGRKILGVQIATGVCPRVSSACEGMYLDN